MDGCRPAHPPLIPPTPLSRDVSLGRPAARGARGTLPRNSTEHGCGGEVVLGISVVPATITMTSRLLRGHTSKLHIAYAPCNVE